MAITEYSPGRQRRRLAYWGERPPEVVVDDLVRRGFEVIQLTSAELSDDNALLAIDSVVATQETDNLIGIRKFITLYAERLLDFDCRIYVRIAPSQPPNIDARAVVVDAILLKKLPVDGLRADEISRIPELEREREGIAFAPAISILDISADWSFTINRIADNPAGRSPNLHLEIDVLGKDRKKAEFEPENDASWKLLLKRAFPDCTAVHLIQMVDGMSGVQVYRLYASVQGSLGRHPFLCFVKIGNRQMIATEYYQYQQQALSYIPYHLGPRLNSQRCGLGAKHGILVGDFVEEAEVFRDCAISGRGVPVIANLFNTTLRSWRDLSAVDELRSLVSFFEDKFPNEIPEKRSQYVQEVGRHASLAELKDLFRSRDSQPVRVGPVHGDLHATNVLARGADAIVIDFEKSQHDFPLLYDAASLEGGLFVEGFVEDERSPNEIMNSVLPLYECGARLNIPEGWHPKEPSTWFFDCVRQIRMYARSIECKSGQYETILAYSLIRKACNKNEMNEKRQRLRACAYHLAEMLLQHRETEH